jgi:DNA (cytosine-5)-methyltransferase 1
LGGGENKRTKWIAVDEARMNRPRSYSLVSLFTGAGGLDLGLEEAGFWPALCVENDADARRTLATNRRSWRLSDPADIHQLQPDEILEQASLKVRETALLVGGPPCQPFSKSSYWASGDAKRLSDPRAGTLRAFIKAAEVLLPQVLLLENVQGLAYRRKDEGLRLILDGLESINRKHGTSYKPQLIPVNAADYGVPQVRRRVFIVASIDGTAMVMPEPTHGSSDGQLPWLTCWDAVGDLDRDTWPSDLNPTGRWAKLLPSIPEGQNYLWHTPRNAKGRPLFGWRTKYWSFLLKLAKNRPSWTIQAAPGPATGPFHWKNRLLSIEELCRLQTFPSGYKIYGTRRSAQRQVGNAVPSAIGELLGLEIRRQLLGDRVRKTLKLLPSRRSDCPRRERNRPVPREYLELRAQHADHPGTGYGPGAQRRVPAGERIAV